VAAAISFDLLFPKGALAEPNEALGVVPHAVLAETPLPAEILVKSRTRRAEPLVDALSSRAGSANAPVAPVARPAGTLDGDDARNADTPAHAARTAAPTSRDARGSGQLLHLDASRRASSVFDISHTAGGTVASAWRSMARRPIKKEYRRFNITG